MLTNKNGAASRISTLSTILPIPVSRLAAIVVVVVYWERIGKEADATRTDNAPTKPIHPIELKCFLGTTYRSHKEHHLVLSVIHLLPFFEERTNVP
jgi:hypothetical protein